MLDYLNQESISTNLKELVLGSKKSSYIDMTGDGAELLLNNLVISSRKLMRLSLPGTEEQSSLTFSEEGGITIHRIDEKAKLFLDYLLNTELVRHLTGFSTGYGCQLDPSSFDYIVKCIAKSCKLKKITI